MSWPVDASPPQTGWAETGVAPNDSPAVATPSTGSAEAGTGEGLVAGSSPARTGALAVRRTGAVGGPGLAPLVLLHGFTQTGTSWVPVVEALSGRFPIVLPDAPGHGGSSAVRADLWQTADLLAEAVPVPATWVGYSMGGRTALHLALAHPEKVAALVLVSTSAGIDDDAKRAARRAADEALAQRVEQEGTERFLAWWLAQPLFATLPRGSAGLEDRLANPAQGLAASLRLAGAGAQSSLWPRLGELGLGGIPVLLLAGELDLDYRSHAQRMAALIGPTARTEVVPGAGHACHLERPTEVAAAIARFRGTVAPVSEGQADGE
jgi:2-succinyl-6-hydroxy-2,4-cyclohexadiene-1-carboxylate synthase